MPPRLIVNADDYGLTAEVSRGIRDAHLNGIVTSTTCMLNLSATAGEIAKALRQTPNLGLGVHLVLTAGRPLSAPETIPSLCTEDGRFHKLAALQGRIGSIDPAEAEREWRAQIAAFRAAAGKAPTHLDSHHHSSYFNPGLFEIMLGLARESGCAVRLPGDTLMSPQHRELLEAFAPPCADNLYTGFYSDGATAESLAGWIASLPNGTHELMTHPGYCDAELEAFSSYARPRDRERELLTSPEALSALRERGVGLIHFGELEKSQTKDE
jgi:predicted glycoside hydrolase/deacetylase ChbG (UPF0249 family)